MLLNIKLWPAGGEVFNKNTVTMITECRKEFVTLTFGDQFSRYFNNYFAVAPMGIKPFDVFYEFAKVKFDACEFVVGFLSHSIDRNVYLIKPCLNDGANPIR